MMIGSILFVFLNYKIILGCEINFVPLNGCAYDQLAFVNPSTGFIVNGDFCGLEVDKESFWEQPFVFYANAKDHMTYLLIMVDNDNPGTNVGKLFLHWLVTDINGNSLKYGLGIYSGNTVAGK